MNTSASRSARWDWRTRSQAPLLAATLLWLAGALAAEDRTLVVGIRTYPGDPQISVPRYSDRDAAELYRWLTGSMARNVVPLQNTEASLDRMTVELRTALLGAHPGDTVYLFISARGLALPRARNGFIETAGVRENKPESTAISIADVADLIEKSPAAHVLFLADLCRDQNPAVDNRINERVQDRLGRIPKVRGILASAGSRASLEGSLPNAGSIPAGGYGYFAYSFMKSLVDKEPAFGAVFDYVSRDVVERSSGLQRPSLLGARDTFPLWNPTKRSFILNPARLALFFPQQLFTPQPAPPGPAQDDATLEREIAQCSALVLQGRFDEAAARVQSARSALGPAKWAALRDRIAVAAADIGQAVVARYGASDLLPGDPQKLVESDFTRGGRAFAAALAMLATGSLDPEEERILGPYRSSLEMRRLFCDARALAFHQDRLAQARGMLERAAAMLDPPIPEIANALGITYLEYPAADVEGRQRDLGTAIRYFRQSSALSPTWSYPRHNLALAYNQLGDFAAARNAYADAAGASPDLPYIYFNLGLAEQRRNNLKDATAAYLRSIDLSQRTVASLRQRESEWRTELPDDADLAAARADIFHRNSAEAQNALGALSEHRRRWRDAANRYTMAIAANPGHCPARHNLAMLAVARGPELQLPAAPTPRKLVEETTAACPGFAPSWYALGDLLSEGREWGPARRAYEEAFAAAPSDSAPLFAIGRTYENESQQARAAEYYERAARAYEQQPGGSPPLAPPGVYAALIRVLPPGAPNCELYRKAAVAQRSIGGLSRDERRQIASRPASCSSGAR